MGPCITVLKESKTATSINGLIYLHTAYGPLQSHDYCEIMVHNKRVKIRLDVNLHTRQGHVWHRKETYVNGVNENTIQARLKISASDRLCTE